jgi:GT2 family glycosyltransferase
LNISLIIVNYNGEKFLPVYLPDIAKYCNESGISLLVTDDQSTDGSIEFLKAAQIKFTINQSVHHGFASNVNNGIKFAKAQDKFDYFIIANNDVQISSYLLPELKKVINEISISDSKIGLIGFNEMFYNNQKDYLAFDYTTYSPKKFTKTYSLPGCFFIISKHLLEEIGYMDEEYFMYGEDNDYFVRTLKADFSIYNTNLPVMHYSEGSSTNNKLTSWYVYRNAFLFAQKNLGIVGFTKIFLSFFNQIYNPFYVSQNNSNLRVTRNGIFYNSYLLIKSMAWNFRYFLKKRFLS